MLIDRNLKLAYITGAFVTSVTRRMKKLYKNECVLDCISHWNNSSFCLLADRVNHFDFHFHKSGITCTLGEGGGISRYVHFSKQQQKIIIRFQLSSDLKTMLQ